MSRVTDIHYHVILAVENDVCTGMSLIEKSGQYIPSIILVLYIATELSSK